ncbi:MAG TPA: hypothetical protein VHB69_02980 [Mycobacteriales bacterium]|nr:hypothetical protein [Mycobacteriales bacterium]
MTSYYRRNFLALEGAGCLLLTAGFVLWLEAGHGTDTVNRWLATNRGPFYGAVAALDGALLGFVIATAAIVLGFAPSTRFAVLRASSQYQTLWQVFTSTIRALGLATLAALAALLVDRDAGHSTPAMSVFVGFQLYATVRVARSVWVLERVIQVVTEHADEDEDG